MGILCNFLSLKEGNIPVQELESDLSDELSSNNT